MDRLEKQQKDVNDLINTRSVVHPQSQFFSKRQGRLAKRDRKTTAVTPSPREMPDPEDPETRRAAVSCRRPTNTVPRVEHVRQSTAASAIRDASEHELARCASSGGVRKFDLSPPKFVRHCACYIYNTGRPVPPEEQSVTTVDEAPLHQVHRRPSPYRKPQRAVCCTVGLV